ncbi:MAG: CIA30 family protein [Chloracidobacterium sp. CP2_5A]|nr:MAG: CIA30 family protein [Chloracidobacterium sp. CP2_5A]
MTTIFDFTRMESAANWLSMGDAVMGGRSVGRLRPTAAGAAVFEGVVSLENNGGFASARSRPLRRRLPANARLMVECRGDGKTYKLVARTDAAFDGIAYHASFAPPATDWTTCVFAPTDFAPTFRGRVVLAPPLQTASIVTLGLMIAGKQAGPFSLQLRRIGVVPSAPR